MKVQRHKHLLNYLASTGLLILFSVNAWSITCNELISKSVVIGEQTDSTGIIYPYVRMGELPSDYFVSRIRAYVSFSNNVQNPGVLLPVDVSEMEPSKGKNSYMVKEGKMPSESRYFSFQITFQDVNGNELQCTIPPSPGAQESSAEGATTESAKPQDESKVSNTTAYP